MVRSIRATTRRAGAAPVAIVAAVLTLTLIAVAMLTQLRSRPWHDASLSTEGPIRIVSLSPAITQTLVDLGLGDRVVGRTPWCDAVPSEVQVVGSLQDFDAERIVRLQPTHVLVQPPAAGVDAGLAALARAHGWQLDAFALNGLDDIDAMVAALPAALARNGTDDGRTTMEANAERLRAEMAASLVPIDPGDPARRDSGRVLWLFALDPPMAFGRGSYFDDVASRLGMVNAIGVPGYPQLSLEDVHRAQPDTIVLVRESPDAPAEKEAALRSLLGGLDTPAGVNRQLLVFTDGSAMTPGAGVIDLATALRAFLRSHAWPEPHREDAP